MNAKSPTNKARQHRFASAGRAIVCLVGPLTGMLGLPAVFAEPPTAKPEQAACGPPSPLGRIEAQLGKREVILEAGRHGLKYFPDGCIAFIRTTPRYRILFAAGISTYLLDGQDMASLEFLGEVLKPGKPGSFDNGYAGVGGVARDPASGELLALYHAEDQEGMPPIPGGIPGFYCSIGLAVSKDDGASFRKLGPVITGSRPKDLKGRPDQGCGELSVVTDKDNRYLYAYYSDHSRSERRGVQICLARCRIEDAGRTDRWRKYYNGAFEEPGFGGKDTPVISALSISADALFPHVSYLEKLSRYVMVFNISAYRELAEGIEPSLSGIYMGYSHDGIRWSKPTKLIGIYSNPVIGKEIGWHPTLLATSTQSNSARGWLYYGYSESWGHKAPQKPHYLVGQPMSFLIVDGHSPE